jgi:hypothetical protein
MSDPVTPRYAPRTRVGESTPPKYRGVLIADTQRSAQIGLDQMCGLLGTPILSATRAFVLITPRSLDGVRGTRVHNRVLIFDGIEPSEQMWEAIIPCLIRPNLESINVSRFHRDPRPPMTVSDHVFTVRRQDGIGPYPPELPCAAGVGGGALCGLRADQHYAVPLARGARDLLAGR